MSDEEKNSWLEKNTFHHGEFWDILKLVEEKEKKGLTISLCIPTLNEEKTIGKEVLILRSELMERYPLVDEFAVIDSGSQDKTLEVAGNYGADTYLASDILPEVGDKRGKGKPVEGTISSKGILFVMWMPISPISSGSSTADAP